VISAWCTTTALFWNPMTLLLMCKMIIHYRTYLQNGITNTLAMPINFCHTSNQIQTPFNCYFDIYSDKWMYYYSKYYPTRCTTNLLLVFCCTWILVLKFLILSIHIFRYSTFWIYHSKFSYRSSFCYGEMPTIKKYKKANKETRSKIYPKNR